MPEIDFTDVGEPEEWTPAPSGDYILELVEAEDGLTKKDGKPKSSLKFEIVDCDGVLEKYNGRTIYYTATYGDKALPIVKQMLKAFGAEIKEGEPMKWDWEQLLGLKLKANLKSVPRRPNKEIDGEFWPAKNEIRRFLVDSEE